MKKIKAISTLIIILLIIMAFARGSFSLLFRGESGTGKTAAAHCISLLHI